MPITPNTAGHSLFSRRQRRHNAAPKASVLAPLLMFAVVISSGCSEESRPAQRLPVAADTVVEQNSNITYQQLRQQGLSAQHAKIILLHYLNCGVDCNNPSSSNYWASSSHIEQLQSVEKSYQRFAQVRKTLVAEFGPEAENDPLFSFMFFPLGDIYSFMSSAEQIALQDAQLSQAKGIFSGAIDPTANHDPAKDVLSDTSFYEYSLRASPLADQLRMLNISFTEQSYRQTYALLSSPNRKAGEPPQRINGETGLRLIKSLGEQDALKIWATLDSYFSYIYGLGKQYGLTDKEIVDAHQIVRNYEAAIANAYGGASMLDLRDKEQLLDAINHRHTDLAHKYGEELAGKFIAMSQLHSLSALNKSKLYPFRKILDLEQSPKLQPLQQWP